MFTNDWSCAAPVRERYTTFSSPLLGAARISQAIAPRNGGVTNEAVTSARTTRRPGKSVRETSQASGVAIAQDNTPTPSAIAIALRKGRRKVASVTSAVKLANVKAPDLSMRL